MTSSPSYLTFSEMGNNAKLAALVPVIRAAGYDGRTLVFNLPSGPFNACPFAKDCAASVVPLGKNGRPLPRREWQTAEGWKIVNGPLQQFRCYAASMEARSPSLRRLTQRNFDLLLAAEEHGGVEGMRALIERSLRRAGAWDTASVLRLHSNGEFFSQAYFHAWLIVARQTPTNRYYAYTKAVAWYQSELERGFVPENMNITMSRGGTQDPLIDRYGLKESVVVGSEEEAAELGLEVDHDDSHALFGDRSFALVVHGSGNAKWRGKRMQPRLLPMAED